MAEIVSIKGGPAESGPLRIQLDGKVLTITLCNPPAHALSLEMIGLLHQALLDARANPQVNVIVLASTGKVFCAGHDLKQMRGYRDDADGGARSLETLFNAVLLWTGWKAGNFDPARYRRELVANADFRGYDDGLRMTLDCTLAQAARIEALLADARARGVARVGTHREDAALMTCIAPLPSRSDHVHFIDGASGGYTHAAMQIKADI